jgi:hypothetical protein
MTTSENESAANLINVRMAGADDALRTRFIEAERFFRTSEDAKSALSSEVRVDLSAFRLQVIMGKNGQPNPSLSQKGEMRDIWQQWKELGGMNAVEAATEFLALFDQNMNPDRVIEEEEKEPQAEEGKAEEKKEEEQPQQEEVFEIEGTEEEHQAATSIQRIIRGRLNRKNMRLLRWAAATLIRNYRAMKIRRETINGILADMRQRRDEDFEDLRRKLLLRGFEVHKYPRNGGPPVIRSLWFDEHLKKIFVETEKTDDLQGSEKGLFIRDVAEIRKGARSHGFISRRGDMQHSDEQCFSIIASERTFDLAAPSANARDVIVYVFQLLVERNLHQKDREQRGHQDWSLPSMQVMISSSASPYGFHSMADIALALTTKMNLTKGIEMRYVKQKARRGLFGRSNSSSSEQSLVEAELAGNFEVVRYVLFFNENTQRLCVHSRVLSTRSGETAGVHIADVSEIRPGAGAYDFMMADVVDTYHKNKCFSIVGSETTLCFIMANTRARDMFIKGLQTFVKVLKSGMERN